MQNIRKVETVTWIPVFSKSIWKILQRLCFPHFLISILFWSIYMWRYLLIRSNSSLLWATGNLPGKVYFYLQCTGDLCGDEKILHREWSTFSLRNTFSECITVKMNLEPVSDWFVKLQRFSVAPFTTAESTFATFHSYFTSLLILLTQRALKSVSFNIFLLPTLYSKVVNFFSSIEKYI